jgi:hypothetical protein
VAVAVVLLNLKDKELEEMEDQVVVEVVTGQCLQEQVEQVILLQLLCLKEIMVVMVVMAALLIQVQAVVELEL